MILYFLLLMFFLQGGGGLYGQTFQGDHFWRLSARLRWEEKPVHCKPTSCGLWWGKFSHKNRSFSSVQVPKPWPEKVFFVWEKRKDLYDQKPFFQKKKITWDLRKKSTFYGQQFIKLLHTNFIQLNPWNFSACFIGRSGCHPTRGRWEGPPI